MRRILSIIFTTTLLFSGMATSANAGASSIKSISWDKKAVNVGSLDPDKSDAKATLRIKAKDSDGVYGVLAVILNPKASGGPASAVLEFELTSGSSENGTWTAVARNFHPQNSGTWIVSNVYIVDYAGRSLKKENKKSGLGGKGAKLKVTNENKSVPKVTVSVINKSSETCETKDVATCVQVPYEISVKAKTGAPLKNAKVRLVVCYDTEYEECTMTNLGKTDSKGKLRKKFYPSVFLNSDRKPDWSDDEFLSSDKLVAYVSVLPTSKTTYANQTSKVFYLDNKFCENQHWYPADYDWFEDDEPMKPSTC